MKKNQDNRRLQTLSARCRSGRSVSTNNGEYIYPPLTLALSVYSHNITQRLCYHMQASNIVRNIGIKQFPEVFTKPQIVGGFSYVTLRIVQQKECISRPAHIHNYIHNYVFITNQGWLIVFPPNFCYSGCTLNLDDKDLTFHLPPCSNGRRPDRRRSSRFPADEENHTDI